MVNSQIKLLTDSLSNAVNHVLENTGVDIKNVPQGFDLARFDLSQYLMYLSASDGKIEWSEACNISQYFGLDLSPESVIDIIKENNIYSTEFEQEVPLSCKAIVTLDNSNWDNGYKDDCAADSFLYLYKLVGKELITADDNINTNEQTDYAIYIGMLEDYINQNDKFKSEGGVYTGLKKDSSYSTPIKSGVLAPRKR